MAISRRSVLALPLVAFLPIATGKEALAAQMVQPPKKCREALPFALTVSLIAVEDGDFGEHRELPPPYPDRSALPIVKKWHAAMLEILKQSELHPATRGKPITKVEIELLQADRKTQWLADGIELESLTMDPVVAFDPNRHDMLWLAITMRKREWRKKVSRGEFLGPFGCHLLEEQRYLRKRQDEELRFIRIEAS